MDATAFTATAGPIGVLTCAAVVPEAVSDAAGKLFFGKSGDVVSQEFGFNVDLYSLVGTTPLHIDSYFGKGAEGFCAMGLVLLNEPGACLTDGESILPLPVGTVFRHDPCSLHGTCLPDGSACSEGRFVFLAVDYDLYRETEDDPAEFARWALADAAEKLVGAGLLADCHIANPAA